MDNNPQTQPKILVVGSINMDLLLLTDRMPLPGETMISEEYIFGPGGKGANQATACAKLGANTSFVCKVGNDDFGRELTANLAKNNINTDFVGISPSKKTGFCVIMLEDGGNNRLIVHLASNLDITTTDIDQALTQHYDGIIMQFEIAEDIVAYTVQKAREKNIPVIIDAGPAIPFPLHKLEGIEILSPNETETAALCGITPDSADNCLNAAKALAKDTKAKHIVLKLGEKGAFHYHPQTDTHKHYPSVKVTPVDATAAGDVFTAALAIEYLTHKDIQKGIQFANKAGALTVTKKGAGESVPTRAEVFAAFQ